MPRWLDQRELKGKFQTRNDCLGPGLHLGWMQGKGPFHKNLLATIRSKVMSISILSKFSGAHRGNDARVIEGSTYDVTGPQAAMTQRPARAAAPWHRVMSTLACVLGFGLIALVLHEFFHFVTLLALGGDGYITFGWEQGLTHFVKQPSHLWAVHLSGGVLTALFFILVIWFWAWSSRTAHDVNVEAAAFAWALGSIAYAPTELMATSPAVGAVAFGIGFSIAGAVYFMKLMNWMVSAE